MLRNLFISGIVAIILSGCASPPNIPSQNEEMSVQAQAMDSGPYHLWGEFTFFINPAHDEVQVVPKREGQIHLNALKFLEEKGNNFLKITKIKNNGDGTIDLTVKITHPFMGHPELTGFDVKGIIMFNGSWSNPGYKYFYPYPNPMRVSWREFGDPQVLNADGYSIRWSPSYDSGSTQPILNYWPGKYSIGTPTANINAYLNFYTDENRHMFTNYGQKS
jgi:hypothetical protein